MTKTERTAKTVWRMMQFDELYFHDLADQPEDLQHTCRLIARWHLRALARQKRQWINRVCDSEVLWANGEFQKAEKEREHRNQVSRKGNALTKGRKA